MKPSRTLNAFRWMAYTTLALPLYVLALVALDAPTAAYETMGKVSLAGLAGMGTIGAVLGGRHIGAAEGSSATLPVVDGEPPVREP